MVFVEEVCRETASWPPDERFGLISQVRRAAISVPANIAEGSGRNGSAERRHFLSVAHGSLCEAETYLDAATRLGIPSPSKGQLLFEQSDEISRIINGLMRSLGRGRSTPTVAE
jgi:four helix bundle protein